jgi:putative Mg2+ transporter-C (MgtC) family protein
MLEWTEIALRLGVATLAGAVIGLNRDLHGKPIGLRTLSIVALATATITALTDSSQTIGLSPGHVSDATSRVVQGILTGIGFLGAGVIIHKESHHRVRGLTSAALTWLTAVVGIICGAGSWRLVAVAMTLTIFILVFGRSIERTLHRLLGRVDDALSPPVEAQATAVPDQPSDAGPHQPGK